MGGMKVCNLALSWFIFFAARIRAADSRAQ